MVSVIIPAYNDGKYIKDAIESVLAQTYKDYEIIVVNDGSTDNTEEVLRPYIEKGTIRYFYQENRGRAAARNQGIAEAKGDYIAFLDADDFFLQDSLLLRIEAIERCNADIVFADYIKWREKMGAYHAEPPFLKSRNYWLSNLPEIGCVDKVEFVRETIKSELGFCTDTFLCRINVFKGLEYIFDSNFQIGEDIDLWWRLLLHDKVKKIAFVNKPLSVYRFYDASWMKHKQWEGIIFDLDKKILSALESKDYVPKKDLSIMTWNLFWIYKDKKKREFFIRKAISLNPLSFKYWKAYLGFVLKSKLYVLTDRMNQISYKQFFLPYRLYDKIRDNEFIIDSQIRFLNGSFLFYRSKTSKRPLVSFVMPHYNAGYFCVWCIDSILKNKGDVSIEILIADAGSDQDEIAIVRQAISSVSDVDIRFYGFKVRREHPFVLEFLYRKARGEYVVVLDQDSLILSGNWKSLLNEFGEKDHLLCIGIRDFCEHRGNYRFVHPSFIMLSKKRIKRVVKERVLFYGAKPGLYELLTSNKLVEPYYSLVCKINKWVGMDAIEYLDTYKPGYLYGTVGYWKDINCPVVFHKWYSGRIKNYSQDALVDGIAVEIIKQDLDKFREDMEHGSINIEPIEIFEIPES